MAYTQAPCAMLSAAGRTCVNAISGLVARVDYDLTELGRTLLRPVMALVNRASDNQFAISEAHRRFDEAPERGTFPAQGEVHQQR
jgi:DNA-binding HxlR family transcriptional regulator